MSRQIVVVDPDAVIIAAGLQHGLASRLSEGYAVRSVPGRRDPRGVEEEALRLAPEADLLVLEPRSRASGLKLMLTLRRKAPSARVMILTCSGEPVYAAFAHALGIRHFASKDQSLSAIIEIAAAALRGDEAPAAPHARRVFDLLRTDNRNEEQATIREAGLTLTVRELQVLRRIALGMTNHLIALSLSISIETVKEHVQHILAKLQAADRTQAAVWAVRQKLTV